MLQVHVGYALAIAELQRLELAATEDAQEFVFAQAAQAGADLGFRHLRIAERLAVTIGDFKKAREKLLRIGAATDRQKIDQLNKEPRVSAARFANRADQAAQPGQEPVVSDAEQRSAWNIANAGRLDHNRTRLAARKALVPFQHVVGDVALVGRPPRHHRWDPGALLKRDR